jgi:hypothetical protein
MPLPVVLRSNPRQPQSLSPRKSRLQKREEIKGKEGGWQMIAQAPPEGDPSEWLAVIGHTAEICPGHGYF